MDVEGAGLTFLCLLDEVVHGIASAQEGQVLASQQPYGAEIICT